MISEQKSPVWAAPLPDGVWPATIAEVRAHGLEWTAGSLRAVAAGGGAWYPDDQASGWYPRIIVFARKVTDETPPPVNVTGQAADRDTPPTTSEIIAALEAGGRVEVWIPGAGGWDVASITPRQWAAIRTTHGDLPQPGYRIVKGDDQ